MLCPFCGINNPEYAAYCQRCGAMQHQHIQGQTVEVSMFSTGLGNGENTGNAENTEDATQGATQAANVSAQLFLRAPITSMPLHGQNAQTYQDLPSSNSPDLRLAPATLSALSPAHYVAPTQSRIGWRYIMLAALIGLLFGSVATWVGMTVIAHMQQGPHSTAVVLAQRTTPTLASTSPPTPVPPVPIEAEAATNTLMNGAVVAACTNCSGGEKVGYVGNGGTLQFNNIFKNIAGNYTLTIYYCSGETRYGSMSVNGGPATTLTFASTGDFDTPGPLTVTVYLIAGNNTIEFYNNAGWAPDFDRIVV